MSINTSNFKEEFKKVIEKNLRKFLTHAYHRTYCEETSKDLVQDTLLIAFEKLDTFKGKSSLETWIIGILDNKIHEHFRHRQKEEKNIEYSLEKLLFKKNGRWKEEWLLDDFQEEDEIEFQLKLFNYLKKCFSRLSNQYKKVFSLKFFAEKDTSYICKECQCTSDNIWQILHRGKLQLKVCMVTHLKKEYQ